MGNALPQKNLTTNKTFGKMSAERISIRKRYENSKAPHSYGVSRRQEQSPPWHRRPAGGIRRYQRFRTPSDADSQTYEHEFISREDDFVAERRSRGFPTRSITESMSKGGFKHEILKVSPEEAETETGEKQVYFKAVAIVGDFNGNVGLGMDVALKPTRAARGAINSANENVVSIRRGHWGAQKHGLPHTIFCKVSSVMDDLQVRVNPAPRGTGITGPPLARKLLEYAGVQDAYVILRGDEPELAMLCQAILSAVKDTFTIFQDRIHEIHHVRRKEELAMYSKAKTAELLPFNQPKGSCGNVGLFIPDMMDDQLITEDPIDLKEQVSIVAQTFSDFVPGAKMHLTATNADDDKENAPTAAPITLEDAATDLQDAETYIEEINQISIQFKDCDVKDTFPVEKPFKGQTDTGTPSDYQRRSFESWHSATDYMGGGDNNALQGVFSGGDGPDGNAVSPFLFGDQIAQVTPLQPRKRNPIPIIDPNDCSAQIESLAA